MSWRDEGELGDVASTLRFKKLLGVFWALFFTCVLPKREREREAGTRRFAVLRVGVERQTDRCGSVSFGHVCMYVYVCVLSNLWGDETPIFCINLRDTNVMISHDQNKNY